MSEEIERWKERNLRRVDIAGMSIMVLGNVAMVHLEDFQRETTKMKVALFRIQKLIDEIVGNRKVVP